MQASQKRFVLPTALVVLLLMALMVPNILQTFGAVSPETKAEILLSLLGEANRSVIGIFERLEAKGIIVPALAIGEYDLGLSLGDESVSLMSNGRFSEASQKAIEAMQKFRDALGVVYDSVDEPLTETEVIVEETFRLRDSISKFHNYLLKLEELVTKANAKGYSTEILESGIAEAKGFLNQALISFKQGNMEKAWDALSQAEDLLAQLMEHVRTLVYEVKVERVENFLVDIEDRLFTLKTKAISISDQLTPEAWNATFAALSDAENSLVEAKDFMGRRMVNETVNKLHNIVEREREAVEILKSSNVTSSSFSNELGQAYRP